MWEASKRAWARCLPVIGSLSDGKVVWMNKLSCFPCRHWATCFQLCSHVCGHQQPEDFCFCFIRKWLRLFQGGSTLDTGLLLSLLAGLLHPEGCSLHNSVWPRHPAPTPHSLQIPVCSPWVSVHSWLAQTSSCWLAWVWSLCWLEGRQWTGHLGSTGFMGAWGTPGRYIRWACTNVFCPPLNYTACLWNSLSLGSVFWVFTFSGASLLNLRHCLCF